MCESDAGRRLRSVNPTASLKPSWAGIAVCFHPPTAPQCPRCGEAGSSRGSFAVPGTYAQGALAASPQHRHRHERQPPTSDRSMQTDPASPIPRDAQPISCYAHSLPGRPRDEWESLAAHALAVAALAAEFAVVFGWEGEARTAGLLHDAGKASVEFQAYIRGDSTGSVDHSTMGARIAAERYGRDAARILALCIAGHHAGLADPEKFLSGA